MKQKILVAGGAGFIGSYVVEELLSRGCKVLVVDNLAAGVAEHVPTEAELKIVDLSAPMACQQLKEKVRKFAPDYVIDLAASPYIPDSYASLEWSMQTLHSNISIAVNLVSIILEVSPKINKYVYLSTSEVYGSADSPLPMSESHRLRPQSTYATSKLAVERALLNWQHEHGLPVSVIRQFNTYGPRSTHPYIIPEIISQLSKDPDNLKLGNISAERDFSYVADTAWKIAETTLSHKIEVGGVYNSGAGECWSVKTIADTIATLMGLPLPNIEIMEDRLRPWDVDRLRAESHLLNTAIGKRKNTPFSEGLQKTIDYYKYKGAWLWEKR